MSRQFKMEKEGKETRGSGVVERWRERYYPPRRPRRIYIYILVYITENRRGEIPPVTESFLQVAGQTAKEKNATTRGDTRRGEG